MTGWILYIKGKDTAKMIENPTFIPRLHDRVLMLDAISVGITQVIIDYGSKIITAVGE